MASAAEVRDRTMCALLLVLCCKQTADWCDRRAARVSVDITEPATSTHRRQRSNFVSPSPPQRQQYQLEERSLIATRAKASEDRLNELISIMKEDQISSSKKVDQLKMELAKHHKNDIFKQCKNMGEIVYTNIKLLLQKDFKQSILMEDFH